MIAALPAAAHADDALEVCHLPSVLQLGETCSAVLAHPRVLLYSAHCGVDHEHARAGAQQLAIARCQSYPDGSLFGGDLAFCVLRESAEGLSIVAPALGCEVQAAAPGSPGWLVGFAGANAQRVRRGQLQAVSEEIAVAGPGFAACRGDSGGPLLIEVDDADQRALRVAGVLSASSVEECAEGTAFFTPLWPFIAWLEEQSGFDLSPCGGADGSWSPSSDCQSFSAALFDGERCESPFRSSTCGPAAAQDASPSYVTKSQNSVSCQSVFAGRRVLTSHALGLTLTLLGIFAARRWRRFRDGAMDKRARIM